ncbi:Fe-S cluster assembly protein SufD [Aquirufa sp. ROCK-SH2]
MLNQELVDNLQATANHLNIDSNQKIALQKFIEAGFPTSKLEEWKYTSLKSMNEVAWEWASQSNACSNASPVDWNPLFTMQTCNGHTSFQSNQAIEGVEFLAFDDFIQKCPTFLSTWNAKDPILEENALFDLNAALVNQHSVLWIKKDTKLSQIALHQFCLNNLNKSTAIQSKLIIYLEEGAEFSLMERLSSSVNEQVQLSNYVQEIWVSKSAKFTYIKEQDFQNSVNHIDHTYIYQSDDSQVDTFTFSINGGLIRNNLHFYSNGSQIISNLNGLYVPGDHQLMDTHSVVDHRMPNSESNELYKGVLLGSSTGVFNGKIFVRPDAQKTNAFQSCKNVLASTKATMNTKPQLEIWADDVKCSHGTTTGQLSDEALFYMRSRGISEQVAKTLLLLAFVQEVIDRVENEAIRVVISQKIVSKIQKSLDITLA